MIGPGKYDDQATAVQEATHASGVILIVIGGDKGAGFSVQTTLPVLMTLPAMLREMADQLEADIPHMGPAP